MVKIVKDLEETIADAIDVYLQNKKGEIEVDEDTDFEIYKMIERSKRIINEELESLDEDIDTTLEQMNEPSDYENDLKQDDFARTRDLI